MVSSYMKNNIVEEEKYSVLMSVYYKEDPIYLKNSLDSMLEQTLLPDQIVLVKDGPLNKNLDTIIEKYVEGYCDIFTIVPLEVNKGLGIALDEGLKYCRNELIARMDTDDISLPERCRLQVQAFKQNPNLSIVGTVIDEFYDNPSNIVSSRKVPTKHEDILRFIRRRSPFNHPTVMFKKSEVIRCGGYGKLKRKQDLDLFSRMMNYGCIGANLDEALVLFRSNEENFRRRKSWSYCRSYIKAQYTIWQRGHCSILDFAYVTLGQTIMYLSPMWLLKWISNKFLRVNVKN